MLVTKEMARTYAADKRARETADASRAVASLDAIDRDKLADALGWDDAQRARCAINHLREALAREFNLPDASEIVPERGEYIDVVRYLNAPF